MVQIQNPDLGAEMFDAVYGTDIRPTGVLVQAAQFALGEECTEDEAKKFLRKRTPKHLNFKGARIRGYIMQGQGSAIDVVRIVLINSFRRLLPTDDPFIFQPI